MRIGYLLPLLAILPGQKPREASGLAHPQFDKEPNDTATVEALKFKDRQSGFRLEEWACARNPKNDLLIASTLAMGSLGKTPRLWQDVRREESLALGSAVKNQDPCVRAAALWAAFETDNLVSDDGQNLATTLLVDADTRVRDLASQILSASENP